MTTYAYPPKAKRVKTQHEDLNNTQNLVNPEWEFIDPTPNVHSLFSTFNYKFFLGKLSCVELEWSTKMYQCAGICYSRRNRLGMSITIRLSEPLLKLRSRKDLIETLLHEMIHAWNFIRGIMEENGGHGKNFLAKMHEINKAAGTNISVYHTFRDEVELYKKHWWRCEGPCKSRGPFYGFVKRTSNRAPGPNDRWFSQHQRDCGGKFIKVKEPTPKKKKSENSQKSVKSQKSVPSTKKPMILPPATPKTSGDIRKYFKPDEDKSPKPSSTQIDNSVKKNPTIPIIPKSNEPAATLPSGSGIKLGGAGNGRSRLLDMFPVVKKEEKKSDPIPNDVKNIPKTESIDIDDYLMILDDDDDDESTMTPGYKSFRDSMLEEFSDDEDEIIFIDGEFDDKFPQPQQLSSPDVVIVSETTGGSVTTDLCHCPVCNIEVKMVEINDHLNGCLGL